MTTYPTPHELDRRTIALAKRISSLESNPTIHSEEHTFLEQRVSIAEEMIRLLWLRIGAEAASSLSIEKRLGLLRDHKHFNAAGSRF